MRRATKLKVKNTLRSFGIIIGVAVAAICIVLFAFAQNNVIIPKNYIYQSDKIPKTFVGYTIAHVSDIANKPMMANQIVGSKDPDIVLITGNFCDSNGEYNNSLSLVEKLAKQYKVLYVIGENDTGVKDELNSKLSSTGAINIEGTAVEIDAPEVNVDDFISKYIGDRFVRLAESGDDDAKEYIDYTKQALGDSSSSKIVVSGLGIMTDETDYLDYVYGIISLDKEIFQIALMNQSQYFNDVSMADIDVILSGNTFGTDRFSNGRTSGLYSANGTALFLSSGIGKSPSNNMRFLNFPSIGFITLSDGTISNDNPLEKLLSYFIDDVKTRFDNDAGFKTYRYDY